MLELIIANCSKLLGLYLVIGTGMRVVVSIGNSIPPLEASFDDYWWLLSSILLFWALSKSLPDLLSRVIGIAVSHDSHLDSVALTMAAANYATKYAGVKKDVVKSLVNKFS